MKKILRSKGDNMFKIGDAVRCINKDANPNSRLIIGNIYIVTKVDGNRLWFDNYNDSWSDYQFELVHLIVKEKNMNIKSVWNQIKRSEPEKTFNKLGITDENDELTAEGLSLYQNWRFQQDKAQFKTEVADPILAEQEKE